MNSNLKPKSKKNNIVIQNFDNETLIYDLSINKAFCLNQTSATIWQLCDGAKTVAEIADLMSKNLKIPVSEDFVWLAISDLQKENLIEVESNQHFFEGKSRREVIRKIGLASMIALPVISSLVAPGAVDAQSGCRALGQSCAFNNSYTQSNCCTSNLRCTNSSVTACTSCITANNPYVSGPLGSSSECQQACIDSANQKNKCCNSSASGSFTYSGGVCSCRCG